MTCDLTSILKSTPVVPVVTISDLAQAIPLARALVAGGLSVIEITLRTPVALEAIRLVVDEVPQMSVGAGTILNASDFEKACKAGASFIVSPGSTPNLLAAATDSEVPWLPGVATISEMMVLREAGCRILKFFPAEYVGGASLLRAVAAPLPDLSFCPTGGINFQRAQDYLSLPNVLTIGGSWMTPLEVIAANDWAQITDLAHGALALQAHRCPAQK